MRRHILGIIALAFLLAAAGIWFWGPEDYRWLATESERVAIVLGVLWLAYHDLRRIPIWIWPASLVALVIAVRWPKSLLLLVPVLILLAILRPRRR